MIVVGAREIPRSAAKWSRHSNIDVILASILTTIREILRVVVIVCGRNLFVPHNIDLSLCDKEKS